ncbi:hypothetical protein [Pedobacter paludis]|uniref:DUF4488 domain-containing protein n=1 Tax=Pedobacter paludis TaxID=2203212 RepID=A0A317EWY7_9SPHI|nr:hypothetical protein [Pedobacter paludis]PWS30259.1 hypothetical protein DF947_17640 [Pedobacter paludis]
MKNNALKTTLLILLFAATLTACKKQTLVRTAAEVNSFLPMQVGNLWYMNKENYTEIKDSVMISGKLYYQFYSLVGGDGIAISYLRIDESGKLIASDPKYPTMQIQQGSFNGKIGDKFFTTGQGSDIDQEVTITEKTDTKISFSFDYIYHPNLKGHPYLVSYIKGQGFPGNWTRLRINGVEKK